MLNIILSILLTASIGINIHQRSESIGILETARNATVQVLEYRKEVLSCMHTLNQYQKLLINRGIVSSMEKEIKEAYFRRNR